MKKKKLLILLIGIGAITTGCTAQYNLTISDKEFKEEFSSVIYKSEIPTTTSPEIELDDQLTPFIEQDQHPIFDNYSIVYEKEVTEEDDYRAVNLKYSYKPEEFSKANSLRLCFDNAKYTYDNSYKFHATGAFYCLYNNQLDINITTKNKVLSNDADEVSGNTYTWHIDKNNANDISINIEISKHQNFLSNYSFLIMLVCVILIFALVIIFVRSKKRRANKL